MPQENGNGVTYGQGHHNESADWLKVLGGGVGGYLFGRWQENGRGGRYGEPNGCNPNGGAPYGGNPYGGAPYGGYCSENTPVNRFERQQEKENAADKATIAKLESEKYTDQVGIQLYERLTSYIDKQNDKQDLITADLVGKACDAKTTMALNAERLKQLNKEICDVSRETREAFAAERAYNEGHFVAQPRVKICCGSATIVCEDAV